MMSAVFGGRFVDLRPLTNDMLTASTGREPDGIHFNRQGIHTVAVRLDHKLLTERRSSFAWGIGIALAGLVMGGIGFVIWRRRRLAIGPRPIGRRIRGNR